MTLEGDGFLVGGLALGCVEGASVNGAVLCTVVIGVDVAFRELGARDVDVGSLLFRLADRVAERSDIPDAQFPVVGDRNNSVSDMGSDNIHGVNRVLVPLGR